MRFFLSYSRILTLISAFGLLLLSSSCATIIKNGKGDLYLKNAPEDLVVFEDGEMLPIELMENTQAYTFKGQLRDDLGGKITTYYSYGVTLSNPSKERELVLKSDTSGEQKTVKIETRFRTLWFLVDLFTTGGIGIVVDAVTGDWYEFAGDGDDLKYLDVKKHLEN